MNKTDRNHTDEVYVLGFVPTHRLPKKTPISLDPFLEPLVQEIEDGFIGGSKNTFFLLTCNMSLVMHRYKCSLRVGSTRVSSRSSIVETPCAIVDGRPCSPM